MRQGENAGVAVGRRFIKGLKVIACAAAIYSAGNTQAQNLFDWGTDPITGPALLVSGYTPAPFLRNPGTAVASYFGGLPAGSVKAVKIENTQTLTPATVAAVYGANNVNYTFADYEGATALARLTALRNQIAGSAGTGPAFLANQSFVGNFNFYPVLNDPTRPASVIDTGGHYGVSFNQSDYFVSGVNMANESLYPGSPDFRSPVQGNSTAPNIRSSLFTLPITRASLTTAILPVGHKHIPYVTRFNNFGNPFFANGVDANGQPAFYFDAAHGTAGQLLSRGDFSALIAHYRARGVDGVHVLDGGVVGYTTAQKEQDVADGWHFAPFENILNGGGARLASLDTVLRADGNTQTLEAAGMVFSGVYSLTQAGGLGKLALLVSNLDDTSHNLTIPNKIGGKTVPGAFTLLAGQHKLLDFTGSGSQWALQNPGGTVVFADTLRDGVGVPEPTMVGGLAIFGCLGLARRRKVKA